ncbi:radical SAM protein [candidate division KSB1 bacterium]|nr:radical SAM protein [candidate division KSB1 bacterium]
MAQTNRILHRMPAKQTGNGSYSWSKTPKIIWGFRASIIKIMLRLHILFIAIAAYRNARIAVRVLHKLLAEKRRIQGDSFVVRYVKAGGRYYWSFLAPGWPSPAFRQFVQNELARAQPFDNHSNHLQILILAMTRKCGLHCEHCFDWDNLDGNELLGVAELRQIIQDFQERGVTQIQLSGGEPLSRFADVLELLRAAKPTTEFWLLSSGFGLSLKKARLLKKAGLAGMTISLDHWQEEAHNRFRGNEKSFYWVQKAVMKCHEIDLPVSLSLCATGEFISEDNLWKYLALAKQMGVGFVRILEPRQVGRYAQKDVDLSETHLKILKDFYFSATSDNRYRDWPIVLYHGYHQREYGCFGAGDRFLYIDSNGKVHACPFCLTSAADYLSTPIDECLDKLRSGHGCLEFSQPDISAKCN